MNNYRLFILADITQMVECHPCNVDVEGSSPSVSFRRAERRGKNIQTNARVGAVDIKELRA